jgi:putative ABC transport system permease protein
MGKATLKGLLAHKFRLAATALAIVLGVGFVAGTYVLTDTMNSAFKDLFKTVTQGTDVAIRTKATFGWPRSRRWTGSGRPTAPSRGTPSSWARTASR